MIKAISKEDIPECVKVIRTSFLTVAVHFGFTEENAPRFVAFATSEERLNHQFEEHRPMFAYYTNEQKIAGYFSLEMQPNGECELNNLCVLPEYRHGNIGAGLFQYAVLTARDLGCNIMNISIVEENTVLRKWYEKLGAVHIGTRKFEFCPFTSGYMKVHL